MKEKHEQSGACKWTLWNWIKGIVWVNGEACNQQQESCWFHRENRFVWPTRLEEKKKKKRTTQLHLWRWCIKFTTHDHNVEHKCMQILIQTVIKPLQKTADQRRWGCWAERRTGSNCQLVTQPANSLFTLTKQLGCSFCTGEWSL